MDPELFDTANLTPGREAIEAKQLCYGCTVEAQCAGDALLPMAPGSIVRVLKKIDPESGYSVPVSGVVRAGMVIPELEG